MPMTPEESKTYVREALANFGNAATRDKYMANYAPTVALHGFPPDMPPTKEGLHGFYQMLWTAFPDISLRAEDIVVEGERVAVRFAWEGTHKEAFMGVPATGRKVRSDGVTILRIVDRQIVERWHATDMLGFFAQLGMTLVPAPAGAPA